jgi:hypothetical protein
LSLAPRFQPGQIGNPTGKNGSGRALLSKKLIEDIAETWQAEGIGILRIMAKEDPASLAKLAFGILPKDVLVSVEQKAPGGLSVEDWSTLTRLLDVIRACVPADAGPGEVFEVIETALRSHYATPVPARQEAMTTSPMPVAGGGAVGRSHIG